ncbi:MAG: sigma-70 family RNA polymerase sigma factor [Bacteroidales bacterium]|nr:sigma-70 family RNA polymerase sigma factor [Bacteroidales bacterium]
MNEQQLIEQIRRGDKKKLEELYIRYRAEFITWLTTKYNVSTADAKDAYQQSVVLLYENIVNNKLETMKSKIKTYLFAIGKNLVHEQNRRTARYSGLTENTVAALFEEGTGNFEENEIQFKAVKASLEKLGDPCKRLLELYYYHRKSMDEISNDLDYKNQSTTKNVKYKCLVRLRKIFQDELQNLKGVAYE